MVGGWERGSGVVQDPGVAKDSSRHGNDLPLIVPPERLDVTIKKVTSTRRGSAVSGPAAGKALPFPGFGNRAHLVAHLATHRQLFGGAVPDLSEMGGLLERRSPCAYL